jgi:sensor histidine kinase YesM
MTETVRYWGRILSINLVATLAVMVAQGVLIRRLGPSALLRMFLISALFCNTIGSLIAVIVPRASLSRWRFPANWAWLIAILLAINAVGCGIGSTVLALVGIVPWRELFREWLMLLRFGTFFTLVFGIAGTLYETLRSKLEETTLALRTKELEKERARTTAIEAQLASLESRVHPHFLFNTLNSISELVHDDPASAERVVGQLASLLRSSLDGASMPVIPLDQELRVVRDYLEIERVRFGNRLRYDVQVADGLGEALLPRLALQTLVENSVKYAVSSRQAGASILIRATNGGGRVRLDVEDDGPGFDAACAPDGHGLALVRSRLAMTFGDRASLRVESRPGRTLVTLDLPS